MPVGRRRTVWHIGYQDVIAIGHLYVSGRLSTERVIALAGPVVREPKLIRTRDGADTNELVRNAAQPVESRVISGSILSGRRAAGAIAYIGRYDTQISVLAEGRARQFLGWLAPGRRKYSATNAYISSLLRERNLPLTTSQQGSPRAMVPIGSFERIMPLDILPTQLLRAIVVGDTETAVALGCLELDEQDLALCSFVCPSKYDYGPALRSVLDQVRKETL
jgi:Na+-transporting NADH:ubiquinone oxidoreductase subunit A